MAKNSNFTVRLRRKRQKRTDYRARKLLILSNKPRLVVRKSLKNISAQIVLYNPQGDKIVAAASTKELKKLGWNNVNNIPTAYLLGIMIGNKAQKHNIKEAVLDHGLYPSTKGSKIYAVVKGAVDAGLKVPHSKDILPSEEMVHGIHIINHAALLKNHPEKLKKHFSKSHPEDINKKVNEMKSKLIGK